MYVFWIKMVELLRLKELFLPNLNHKIVFCWYKLVYMGSVMLNIVFGLSKASSFRCYYVDILLIWFAYVIAVI